MKKQDNIQMQKPKYLEVIHRDRIYWFDGKMGRDIKTGRISAEYRYISKDGDSRVWADAETGDISIEHFMDKK